MDVLPLYKKLSVPIYHYPLPQQLHSIKEQLLRKYGTMKRTKREIRKKYRCFLSENAIWKTKVYIPEVTVHAVPPVNPRVTLINVMARGLLPPKKFDYVSYIRNQGLKPNPYKSFSDKRRPPFCFGFYVPSFKKLEDIVDNLGARGLIDGAIVVNAVWYLKLGRPVNLSKLVKTNIFVSSTSNFKAVTGVIDGVKVTVFNTGTIRLVRATTPEIAENVVGKTYGVITESKALMG